MTLTTSHLNTGGDHSQYCHDIAMLTQVRIVLLAAAFLQPLVPAASSKDGCPPTSKDELRERLGPAFNARYMSIDKPPRAEEPARIYARHTESVLQSDVPYVDTPDSEQADEEAYPSFRVDPDFVRDVASSGGHADAEDKIRPRRNLESVDQGMSYGMHPLREEFPWASHRGRDGTSAATLRHSSQRGNVKRPRRHDDLKKPWGCDSRVEWLDLGEDRFPRYLRTVRCRGEACWFTHFRCKGRAFTVNVLKRAPAQPECEGPRSSSGGLPIDLREKWVFEERAVTFCCDCSAETDED